MNSYVEPVAIGGMVSIIGDTNDYTNGRTNGDADPAIGIDAHVPVIRRLSKSHRADAATKRFVLLPCSFSAQNEGSLKLHVAAMADTLTTEMHPRADVAYTLSDERRTKLMHHSFRIVKSADVTSAGMAVDQPISSMEEKYEYGSEAGEQ